LSIVINPTINTTPDSGVSGVGSYDIAGTVYTGTYPSPAFIEYSNTCTGIYFFIPAGISYAAGTTTNFISLISQTDPTYYFSNLTDYGVLSGGNGPATVYVQYNVAAYYDTQSNATSATLARYMTDGTAVFQISNAGVWTQPQADAQTDTYQSDATNFPATKSVLILNSGVPSFRTISRTSMPANGISYYYISGLINIAR